MFTRASLVLLLLLGCSPPSNLIRDWKFTAQAAFAKCSCQVYTQDIDNDQYAGYCVMDCSDESLNVGVVEIDDKGDILAFQSNTHSVICSKITRGIGDTTLSCTGQDQYSQEWTLLFRAIGGGAGHPVPTPK